MSPFCFAIDSVLLSLWGRKSRATSFFLSWVHLLYERKKKTPLGVYTLVVSVVSPVSPPQQEEVYITYCICIVYVSYCICIVHVSKARRRETEWLGDASAGRVDGVDASC